MKKRERKRKITLEGGNYSWREKLECRKLVSRTALCSVAPFLCLFLYSIECQKLPTIRMADNVTVKINKKIMGEF